MGEGPKELKCWKDVVLGNKRLECKAWGVRLCRKGIGEDKCVRKEL